MICKINEFLEHEVGFKSYPHEYCLYEKYSGGTMMYIALYIDNLLISGDNCSELLLAEAEFCMLRKDEVCC